MQTSRDEDFETRLRQTFKEDQVRLIDLLKFEFNKKRNVKVESLPPREQIPALIEFWQTSLSREKILHKLQSKAQRTHLVDKERNLMAFLDGSDN